MVARENKGREQSRRGFWKDRDKIPDGRVAWTAFDAGSLFISQYEEMVEDEETGEKYRNPMRPGSAVVAHFKTNFGNKALIKFILTNMTAEELEAFQYIFNHAVELARPVVEERDRIAREALESGADDHHERVYRSPPTRIVRERKKPQH